MVGHRPAPDRVEDPPLIDDNWGVYSLELFLDFVWGDGSEVVEPILALLLIDCILDLFDVFFDLTGSEFGLLGHVSFCEWLGGWKQFLLGPLASQ
jgi:hypothetical protein